MKSEHNSKSLIITVIINGSTLTPLLILTFSSISCVSGLVKWAIPIGQTLGLQVGNDNDINTRQMLITIWAAVVS